MTKYLLFAGRKYYPAGGAKDFVCGVVIDEQGDIARQVSDSLSHFGAFAEGRDRDDGDWWQLVNPLTLNIAWDGVRNGYEDEWEVRSLEQEGPSSTSTPRHP